MGVVISELKALHPKPNSVIKHKVNDYFVASVVLTCSQDISSDDLTVELWSNINSENSKKYSAFPLKFSTKHGEKYIFSSTIKLNATGNFDLAFRAKTTDQQQWVWTDHGNHKTTATLWVDPDWTSDAIVYNAFIRYFGAKSLNKNGSINPIEARAFDDLKTEIRKLKSMGINVLYLNPVHPVGELFRNYNPNDLLPTYLQSGCPYSIKDYNVIDSEIYFGNTGDQDHPFSEFKKFVDFAHEHGIRVFMDLVFNHAAHDAVFQRLHPEWFLYKEDIWSLEAPYIYPEELKDGKPWGDPKHTFSPNDHGHWWNDAAQLNWNNIDQYSDDVMRNVSENKPPKNPTIDEMYDYFKNVVKFYIDEFGIDGFRCDLAHRVPLDFWKECIVEARKTAKTSYPENGSIDGDVIFIAESYDADISQLLEAGFTSCYGEYSKKLDSVSNLSGYLDYMYNLSGNHFPEGSDWFIFPKSYDFHSDTKESNNNLNANKSRWTITACLPGMPMIFGGFEQLEWKPMSLFSYSSIDWEANAELSKHITKVNAIKHQELALQKGSYYKINTSQGENASIFSFARVYGNETIIIAVNLDTTNESGTELYLPDSLSIDFSKDYELEDLYSGETFKRQGNNLGVILPAGEAHIFKVRQ